MTPFVRIEGAALVLLEDRIDTDIIFPARFLLLMEKKGLGRYLFYDRRFDAADQPLPDAIDPGGAAVLLGGADFGCGSSREQAVWALVGAGISCVIAESFGEIFAANSRRNGLLAITLDKPAIARLAAANTALIVDLPGQTVAAGDVHVSFDIDAGAKERLLNGWDEIDMIVARSTDDIARFEQRQRIAEPWMY